MFLDTKCFIPNPWKKTFKNNFDLWAINLQILR